MRSKKEFLYVFASVLLSFILFINASSFNYQNNSSARQVSSETYTNTLTNIPIDAKYNDKIAVSCAYLPLTENTGISKEFGTRHRAAIGLSEVSDAFTFVVSEETGGISVTYNGTFRHDLSLEEFETELRAFLVPEENKPNSWKERLFGRVTK